MQKKLNSWGPGNGYCIDVLQGILRFPKIVESIYNDRPVYPSVLEVHVGTTCPCACIFCYSKGETCLSSDCAGYRPGPNASLLNSNEISSIITEMVDNGCNSIYFSGGLEPFSSRKTVDVLRRLPQDPEVRIYTNGVPDILDGEDVLELAVTRASQIRFSIHAATPNTYNIVQIPHRTDGKEIFQKVIGRVKKAMMIQKRLLDSGNSAARIGVTFLTVPANYAELEDAVDMWSEIGINFFDIGNDALRDEPRTKMLTEEQKKNLKSIIERIKKFSESNKLGGMMVRPSRESVQVALQRAEKCYAPLDKAVLDPYGNLWACCMRAHPFLQRGSFHLGTVRCGNDFQKLINHRYSLPSSLRDVPLEFHCRECTEYEFVANVCIQKLIEDLEFGIPISEQPFLLSSQT